MSYEEFWTTVLPTWVTALATVAAVVAAVRAGRTAKRLYDREAARDQRVLDNAEHAQADLVAAWVTFNSDPLTPTQAQKLPTAFRARGWVCRLRNASNVPVYDLHAVIEAPGGQERARPEPIATLPPGPPQDYPVPDISHALDPTNDENYRLLRVSIRFTDAAGRRWHRSGAGELSPSDR